jgi:hypothetical protein
MVLTQVHSVPLSSPGLVKMEERKRPATYDNEDPAPPHKRQATASVNGNPKAHRDDDMPGKDDLEVSLVMALVTGQTICSAWMLDQGLTRHVVFAEIPKRGHHKADARI